MWTSGAAAGYRDPTTLFDESGASSSSSSTEGSAADYRTLQDLFTAAPGFATAPPPTPPHSAASRWTWLHPRRSRQHRHDDDNDEDDAAAGAARKARRRQQQQQQQQQAERRFFKDGGALDFHRSAVFEGDVSAGQPTSRLSPVAEVVDAWGRSDANGAGGASSPGPFSAAASTQRGSCVPVELQAWYVASCASPSTTSRSKRHALSQQRYRDEVDGAGLQSARTNAYATSRLRLEGPAGAVAEAAPSVFADVAAEPPIRGSGSGTTSVNVLWSQPVSSRALRAASPPAKSAVARRDRSPLRDGAPAKPSALLNPFEAGNVNAPLSPSGEDADDDENAGAAAAAAVREGNGPVSRAADAQTLDSDVEEDDGEAPSADVDTAVWPQGVRGGLPPLRAHRYVEQPNGVFLDHAVHADLLARYALEEQLRHTQAKHDAHRARRWNRLLHRSGHSNSHSAQAGAAAAAATGAAPGQPVRYLWLYDAATYRGRFVATLRYLQRVHVFFVALAAGMSLLTLIAVTIPFPELQSGQVEDGLPGEVSVVLLLAIVNRTAAMTAADDASLTTARVLPVAQQGQPTLALFLTLLQPYHVSLLLFLCIVCVITGFAPVAWGVAERSWTARRRRWLAQEAADAAAGHVPAHRGRSGSSHYHTLHPPSSDNEEMDGCELSESAGTYAGRSPFSHTMGSISLAAPHRSAATPRRSFSGASTDDGRRRGSAAMAGTERGRITQQQQPRRLSPLSQQRGTAFGGRPTAAGPQRHVHDAVGSSHYYPPHDPMRNSISLGMARSDSVWDLLQVYDVAGSSLAELPTAHLSGTATMMSGYHDRGGGSSPHASLPDASLLQVPYALQRQGRSRYADGHSSSGGGGGAATSVGDRASGGNVGRLSGQLPPPLFLLPAAGLEGRLSADNVATRAFDYAERRTMQWLVNGVRHTLHRCCCGTETSGEVLRRPVVPGSLYLHVVLQPRLWCIVVALALTLVELAIVDERSVALLWRAQPASWWSASTRTLARQQEMVLPHTWMSAVLASDTAALQSADRATTSMPEYSGGTWSVKDTILGVYAARMAVIWLAFLLNLFF